MFNSFKHRRLASTLFSSTLVAGAFAVAMPASAQEVGKVISSTPVMKRVTEPVRGCRPEPQRACEMVTEDRLIGYKVVYEYRGAQHEVQLPFPVGETIPLETSSNGAQPASTPSVTPTPVYESAPRVVERVYVEPSYRAYDPYYYGPIWPVAVGLSLGWVGGRYYAPRGYVHYRGGWRHR